MSAEILISNVSSISLLFAGKFSTVSQDCTTKLVSLSLEDCLSITDDGVSDLVALNSLDELRGYENAVLDMISIMRSILSMPEFDEQFHFPTCDYDEARNESRRNGEQCDCLLVIREIWKEFLRLCQSESLLLQLCPEVLRLWTTLALSRYEPSNPEPQARRLMAFGQNDSLSLCVCTSITEAAISNLVSLKSLDECRKIG